MRKSIVFGLAPIVMATMLAPAFAEEVVIVHRGELILPDGTPLGGIFELNFKLFADTEATEVLWHELHYVSVLEGAFELMLGQEVPLDPAWNGQVLHLATDWLGDEIVRQPRTVQLQSEIEPIVPEPQGLPFPSPESIENVTGVTFAQVADRALVAEEAEHAMDSDRLGGYSIDEIIERLDNLSERLAQHERNPEAHGSGGVRIGSTTRILQTVGGSGGAPYNRLCPAGYVVVGMQGRAGGMVDAFQVVCAPLE